ncbi:MAG: TrkH family potassium uptake protein [Candidatus Gastranaerophilales bacterium]|nr:TrkH family potassium uptake protein [Candidatus Gastranaerophilales bacterium]
MRFKVIFNTFGIILKFVSLLFILPPCFAIFYKEYSSILPFLTAGIITLGLGFLFGLNDASEKDIDNITRTEAFAALTGVWIMFGLVCTIPLLFFGLTPINALFEAFSGVSTTGATILEDFSIYPKTFFIYRALMQWFGGMGIIVLFIAVMPKFAVAGRKMFYAETPNPLDEKITPRVRYTAGWLWSIYILLTIIHLILMKIQGLDLYDSICISLSTVSAGGFSNSPTSLIGYSSSLVWICGIFAFIAGLNFLLCYRVLIQGKISEIFKSEEFRTYFFLVLFFTLSISLILFSAENIPVKDALRNAFFETAATITSTGAYSDDYSQWPLRGKVLIFILMFIGGSAISASGSIKITRWIFIFKFIKRELNKIVHPNAIIPIKLEGRIVQNENGYQILIFVLFFIAIFALSTIIVTFIEQNSVVAITGSIATLSNTGPGLDNIIGPLGNYNSLSNFTKLIFIFNMLIGRLEIIPFLALLNKELWQKRGN